MKKLPKPGEDGMSHCEKCNGTQFISKRTLKGKLSMGLLSRQRVKCLGCGRFYKAR